METLKKPEAMLFDLDGTLFKTETLLLPAYYRTFDSLRAEGLYHGETPPEQRILECLGQLLPEIWRNVMPNTPIETRERADVLLLRYQIEGLKSGEGELYEGVEATLTKLRERGIRLFVASNGLEDYVKEVCRYKGIAPLLEDMYSAGEYQTSSKVDLVRLLLERYQIQHAWMVGDRSSDVAAGLNNGLPVIGCDYAGFGDPQELAGATRIIRSFDQLAELAQ